MGFNEATRQNIRSAGTITYASGQQTSLALPRVGYLARIHLFITGVMTVTPGTGTATLGEKAPWNLLRRIRYQIGSGTELFNCSGWGAHLTDLFARLDYIKSDGKISAPYAADVYSVAAATGANTWNFGTTISIVPNERDIVGLILLQAEGTATQVLLEWNTEYGLTQEFPVVVTGNATAAFAGTAKVYLETFTVPAEVENQPPLDRIFQTLERVDPIFATGDNSIKLLEENTYLRIIHSIEINGALSSTAVDSRLFRYNVTDTPYEIERQVDQYLKRRNWTKDFPKGVFSWDFFDQGYPNFGADRDLVMASGLAELESVIRIASGTSLGSNNNVVRTIQQQLVRVANPVTSS